MGFGDLKTRAGQQNLNNFLASRSYISGHVPSQADNVVFEAVGTAPPGDLFHALRFFNHISSFSEVERKAFAGVRGDINSYGESAPAAKPAVDDDDVDLFGSDEDDAEAARIKEERIKMYAAKKAHKPVLIAKSCVKLDVKPWDDETDLVAMEKCVRSVEMEGLVWGQCKRSCLVFFFFFKHAL